MERFTSVSKECFGVKPNEPTSNDGKETKFCLTEPVSGSRGLNQVHSSIDIRLILRILYTLTILLMPEFVPLECTALRIKVV